MKFKILKFIAILSALTLLSACSEEMQTDANHKPSYEERRKVEPILESFQVEYIYREFGLSGEFY